MFKHIEGNPFIIRFKTNASLKLASTIFLDIEGNPFIIRFKTLSATLPSSGASGIYIEGNPFIIRFKTLFLLFYNHHY